MAIVVASSQSFAFADGSTGHVCTFAAGAPSVGDWDVLCVNSATVVATPAGWSVLDYSVGGQGAYLLARHAAGGEPGTVTLTTSGDFNAVASWVRLSGADAVDVVAKATVDGIAGTTSPVVTTAALAASDELSIAFVACHNYVGAAPSSPIWTGYTELVTAAHNTSPAGGVFQSVAARSPVGPAAESPSVQWIGQAFNRYLFVATLTAAAVQVANPLSARSRFVTSSRTGPDRTGGQVRYITTTRRGRS